MPLSEFFPQGRADFDPNQSKMNNSHLDLPSSVPDSEFMELLCEKGQIVLQSQSSRPRKSSSPSFSSQPSRLQEKEGRDSVLPKVSRFGAVDPVPSDFPATGIYCHNVSNTQDDDVAPWLNSPIEDCFMEFLSDLSRSNTSALPVHGDSVPADKRSCSGTQVPEDSHSLDHIVLPKALNGNLNSGRIRNIHNHIPQQRPSSVLCTKSRIQDIAPEITTTPVSNNSSTWGLPDAKLQRRDPVSPKPAPSTQTPVSNGSHRLINFPHFTSPVALLKANAQSSGRLSSNEKGSATTTSTAFAVETTPIESSGGLKGVSQRKLAAMSDKDDVKSTHQPQPDLTSVNQSEATNREDASRDDRMGSSMLRSPELVNVKGFSVAANIPASRHVFENKNSEPIVASSVSSASGAAANSNDAKHRDKRKVQEREESGYQSEDGEDESAVVKKAATARSTSAKRSRAAEVHNLSERRRRDRINEKMRSLQELIPNCNKVDKASMLDEAIEYLKTLQLQVQIMSMGSGLYMPPMMLPPGMPHLGPHHMGHFPPMAMGVGMGMTMGMGVGYGVGMLDTNGSPMVPMPPTDGQLLPCSVSGNPGVPGMAGSSGLQMFGIPGQGYPVPMNSGPCIVPRPAYSAARVHTMPEVSVRQAVPINGAEPSHLVDPKSRQMQTMNSEAGHKVEPEGTCIPVSAQATKERREDSSSMQIKTSASSHTSTEPINSTSGNRNPSTGASGSLG